LFLVLERDEIEAYGIATADTPIVPVPDNTSANGPQEE
jgi:hypothetical protein